MIRNKTIKFNMDKAEDRELWEFLQSLPHGSFSDLTKVFWLARLEVVKERENPEYKIEKGMSERLLMILGFRK